MKHSLTSGLSDRFRHCVILMTMLALSACAGQEAFRQGKSLLDAGKPEEGLVQIKKATEEQPQNIEYRTYYYRQRDVWINRLLKEADTALINRRWAEAEDTYKRVQEIDDVNQRARDGIHNVESGRRRTVILQEAGDLLIKDELEAAREKVRLVLSEDSANAQAISLASRIDQKLALAATPAMRLAAKFRKPVSLEIKDAPVKTVFELLSKSAGVNFILDRDLRQDLKVSVFVKHTTIEAALQNIFSSSQLGKKILDENSVLIYPLNKKEDYEEIVIRTFYLNNVDPKQVMSLLKTMLKVKDIFIDEKLNILVVRDSAENVKLIEKLIASYDLSDPEVLLEVEVLEINSNKLLNLGVNYPNTLGVGVKGAGAVASNGSTSLTFDELHKLNPTNGFISFTNPVFVLNLLATDSDSKLLANPRIRVKNHKKAKIHIGDRVPVITTTTNTNSTSESVNYLDVGIKLEVEPSVMVSDEVSIDIGLEVSNIAKEITSKSGTLTYQVGTRNANTTLRLKNGETQVLAGLINDTERSSSNRVPGLSSLPIIGRLFANKNDTHDKSEIVLLITPRIVRNVVPPDASLGEFSVGTESGNAPSGRATAFGYVPPAAPDTPKREPLPPISVGITQQEPLPSQPQEIPQQNPNNNGQQLLPQPLPLLQPPPPPLPPGVTELTQP